MEAHVFLLELVLILFSAKLAGQVASWCRAPSVLGELCAGIVIGPSLLQWVEISDPIQVLAQIGVILLLFEVGMETNVQQLAASGMKAFAVATAGILLPFFSGFYVSFCLFDFSLLVSLFIASTLTATSIGITLRVLKDLSKQETAASHIILGAAVLDDIVGIIILSLLYDFSFTGSINFIRIGTAFLCIALFFLIVPFLSRYFALWVKRWEEKSTIAGLLPALILVLVLFFAFIAETIGAPELLGGFVVGLGLSRRFLAKSLSHFRQRIEHATAPITHFFTPIFFVSIGLSLNLSLIDWGSFSIWALTGSFFVVAILGKFLSGFFIKGESLTTKTTIGLAMIPRGEVGLIFASIGLTAKIFSEDIYAALVLVIALTTLFAPFALRFFCKRLPHKN